ncbi:pectinesterase inhibitor-like [Coffea eugenioides]|uniref:pectinesterase inhibitor-like n=1 Tax=Coffea eugenioides TaxID=49369 RepID=UPI000F60EA19|nr:pectinesterase inhibitor-like [Coffea eugenioides]
MKKAAFFFLVFVLVASLVSSRKLPEPGNSIKALTPVLNSIPRTPGASLEDLAQISIDLAESHANSTYKLIESLARKTNDPKLKDVYQACLENYEESIDSLALFASAAETGADTCEDGFSEGSYPEAPEIKQANQKLEDLCSIIIVLVISNRLLMA